MDGANIDFSEHGSENYSSNEILSLSSTRLSADKNLRAKGTFALVDISSHPLCCSSSWYANRVCENRITKATLKEKYLHANTPYLGSNAEIHKKETCLETESNFTGIAEFASKGKNIAVDEMFIESSKPEIRRLKGLTPAASISAKVGWKAAIMIQIIRLRTKMILKLKRKRNRRRC